MQSAGEAPGQSDRCGWVSHCVYEDDSVREKQALSIDTACGCVRHAGRACTSEQVCCVARLYVLDTDLHATCLHLVCDVPDWCQVGCWSHMNWCGCSVDGSRRINSLHLEPLSRRFLLSSGSDACVRVWDVRMLGASGTGAGAGQSNTVKCNVH